MADVEPIEVHLDRLLGATGLAADDRRRGHLRMLVENRDAALTERERDGFRERLRLLLGRIDHAITELAGAGNEVQEAIDGEWIESDSTDNRVRRDDRGCVVVTWRLDGDDLALLAADTVTSDVRELAQATLAKLAEEREAAGG